MRWVAFDPQIQPVSAKTQTGVTAPSHLELRTLRIAGYGTTKVELTDGVPVGLPDSLTTSSLRNARRGTAGTNDGEDRLRLVQLERPPHSLCA